MSTGYSWSTINKLAARMRGRLQSLAGSGSGVGVRLLIGVLLFSGLVALLLTAIQLYIDYRRDVAAIETRLSRIGESYLDSLAEGLWSLDEKQLRLQLDGIFRLPDIRVVEVRDAGTTNNPLVIKLSRTAEKSAFARDFPLLHKVEGQDRVIGTLHVEATLANVYQRLADAALTILLGQMAQTFLVSLFTLYIFHYLVTRHLSAIADDVGSYSIDDLPLQLRLRRRPPGQEDELQRLVTAFNTMSHNLHIAYRDLAQHEGKILRLVDSNIIGIFFWDFEGRILEANDAFLRMLGYGRDDLAAGSIRWTDLTPREWHDRDARLLEENKLTGRLPPFEKEYFRKDGTRVPVLIGVATLEEGGNQGIAFVLDLTEQKQAEAALRESEEQWKAVFENNPVMYFLVDATGTILSVNYFGAEQLGYTVDELIGRPVQILFHEADRASALRAKAACLGHLGQSMSWEMRKVRKNGDVIWVRETARAMVVKNRPVVLVMSEDFTEGKRVAEALREVQTELAHANRLAALGQLTASIAHEVNQPIAGVLSSGQAALRWLNKSDLGSARRAIERIIRDATRAGDVIGGLRVLVRKVPPRAESFDINEAIREVIVITRGEAAKNVISVETQLAEGLPLVQGVRVRLQQVILNLIINAIEAMSGADEERRELLVKTAKSGSDSISVAVQDSGPGLDPENPERAFEAFYTTKPEGLGLGLSICRSIVEAHGGGLRATANVPHGAIFQLTVRARGDGSATANA
jgi:PAS domain S-box-containing protein